MSQIVIPMPHQPQRASVTNRNSDVHQPQRDSVRFRQKPRASSAQRLMLILCKDYVELNFQFLTLVERNEMCGQENFGKVKPPSATIHLQV